MAVDGPRGPAKHPHAGAVLISSSAQRPIVCAAAHALPAKRLGSWDRMKIPHPFAKVTVAYSMMQPPAPGRAGRTVALVDLKERLDQVTSRAAS